MAQYNTIFIPREVGPTDPGRRALLEALVGENTATFSDREMAVMERASEHGECYWATVDVTDQGHVEVGTDLGDPGSSVFLRCPPGTTPRVALEALDEAVQRLLRVD